MIIDPTHPPEPTAPHPDGRPLWLFRWTSWDARQPRDAVTADRAVAEWMGRLAARGRGDAYATETEDVPGRPGLPLLTGIRPIVAHAFSVSPAPDLPDTSPGVPAGPLGDWACALRAYLEAEGWPDYLEAVADEPEPPPGTPASQGMCGVTTALAARLLRGCDPDGGWDVSGGHPTVRYPRMASQFRKAFAGTDGGLWDRERGRWDGHYWLTGTADGVPVILDLTADQYGWDAVTLADGNDPRFRASYRPAQVRRDLSFGHRTAAWVERHAEAFSELRPRVDASPPAPPGPRS